MTVPPPRDPVSAVTHPDPYPYYAGLTAERPLYKDEREGYWIASSAATVTAVLTSARCRVRPPAEPVPKALLGSAAGEIFRRLVRMNDGGGHEAARYAVAATVQTLDLERVAQESARWARPLVGEGVDPAGLSSFVFALPVHVMGSLLGMPPAFLRQTTQWMSHFVRCLAPASTPPQIERGKDAAGHLLEVGHMTLQDGPDDGLLPVLARQARRAGIEDTETIVANGIGFMSQAYEATAGLIGNTLLALAARPELRAAVTADSTRLPAVIREVSRHDAPVQNTRRWVADAGAVAGHDMAAGDIVLVVLAAANRDPAANPRPHDFDPHRPERRVFTFGVGPHACPGEMLAVAIASAGVAALLDAGLDPAGLPPRLTYRPSGNTRIPLFDMLT
ncbi:MAG TPA: cytochrome P450 [Methylomirabilota bacterium]|nr:cytochrome P450 [Methylomirabilota bacterium]